MPNVSIYVTDTTQWRQQKGERACKQSRVSKRASVFDNTIRLQILKQKRRKENLIVAMRPLTIERLRVRRFRHFKSLIT